MALPDKTTVVTLDIAYLGTPFVVVETRSLTTNKLDISYLGNPFVAVFTNTPPVLYFGCIIG